MKTRNSMLALLASLLSAGVQAQAAVDVTAGGVRVQVGKGASASNVAGDLGQEVDMEGVAVINGNVYIDGQRIPRGKTMHTSGKTGKVYRIQWRRDGNVAVEEK